MAKINFTDGSPSVPGQVDAKRDQERTAKEASLVPGKDAVNKEAPSVFGARQGKAVDKEAFGPDYGRQRIRLRKSDEVNIYADQEDERFGMDERMRKVLIACVILLVAFVLTATFPTAVFSFEEHPAGYTPAEFLRDYRASFLGFFSTLTGHDTFYSQYFWEVVAAVVAGAALGLSGGVYQGALKNSLASPSTLGVTSGGALGLIIYAFFFYPDLEDLMTVSEYQEYLLTLDPLQYMVLQYGTFFSALMGCCMVVLVIMLIAVIAGRGHVSNVSLIIAGQVITAVITLVINSVQYYLTYTAQNENLLSLVMGSTTMTFNGAYTLTSIAMFAVPVIACMAVVFAMSDKLALLAFKDDEARSMGISTNRVRNGMVALCTVMTALVISFCGPVGFVGFIIPHIARRLVGPEFRYLLPACAALGGILVVVVHWVSCMGIPGIAAGSTGTFTSITGCVFFLVMALRTRGDKRAEWF